MHTLLTVYYIINKEQYNNLSIKCAFVCSIYIYLIFFFLFAAEVTKALWLSDECLRRAKQRTNRNVTLYEYVHFLPCFLYYRIHEKSKCSSSARVFSRIAMRVSFSVEEDFSE